MRFSLVALAGLAVLTGRYGADARAVPTDLALSSSSLAARNIEAVEHLKREEVVEPFKRGVAGRIVPRVPGSPTTPGPAVRPPTNARPGTPGRPANADRPGAQERPSSEQAEEGNGREGTLGPRPPSNPNAPKTQALTYKKDPKAESDDNTCGIVPAKRSLGKRALPRDPSQAKDPAQIYLWLQYESGVDRNKIVFYADSSKFEPVAARFVEQNPGYKHFWTIFIGHFEDAFGVDMDNNDEANVACSEALGMFARNPLVFNHDNGKFSPKAHGSRI